MKKFIAILMLLMFSVGCSSAVENNMIVHSIKQDNTGDGLLEFKDVKGKIIFGTNLIPGQYCNITIPDNALRCQFEATGRHMMYNANLYGLDKFMSENPGDTIELDAYIYKKACYLNKILIPSHGIKSTNYYYVQKKY